ncbi:hypothetical protein GCM10027276_44170 [Comamonas piscis]
MIEVGGAMFKKLFFSFILLFAGSSVLADSIAPASFSTTLTKGQSTTIRKVVTINDEATTSLVDVMFVLDNTGSMGAALTSLRTNIDAAMVQTASLGNVRWGVGHFEDVNPGWGSGIDQAWTLALQPTDDQAAVGAAVNFPLGFGGDTPESNLIGLQSAATEVNWRPGSARFIVYVTDAPGHDPDTTPGYPGPTLQQTIDSLIAANIKVLAFTNTDFQAVEQAQLIADATNGNLDTSGLIDWGGRVAANVTVAASTYTTVSLGLNNPAGVGVIFAPVNHPAGPYDRSVTRTFEFDVTFTAVDSGQYDFTIDALVDGGVVATENDSITVPAEPVVSTVKAVPTVGMFAMAAGSLGIFGMSGFLARRRKNK